MTSSDNSKFTNRRYFISVNPGLYDRGNAAIIEGSSRYIKTMEKSEVSLISRRASIDKNLCDVNVVGVNYKDSEWMKKKFYKLMYPQYYLLSVFYRLSGKYVRNDRFIVAKDIWNEFCTCDVIVAGIGDSFSTTNGTLSFWENFHAILLGKLLNKKVILLGSSIEPFKDKWFEFLGKYILDKPDLITLREELSYEYMRSIGVKNPALYVTADLSFAIDVSPEERITEILKTEGIAASGRKPIIGVCLSRVASKRAFSSVQNRMEKYDRYIELMSNALDEIIHNTSAVIVFIPHAYGPCKYYDDRVTHKFIYQKMKTKSNVVLVENEYSAEELRGLISKCDLFIGDRISSIISSAMLCVPFIEIYSDSFSTKGIICKMLGCEEYVFNMADLDLNRIKARIMDDWDRRELIKKDLKQKTSKTKYLVSQNLNLLRSFL